MSGGTATAQVTSLFRCPPPAPYHMARVQFSSTTKNPPQIVRKLIIGISGGWPAAYSTTSIRVRAKIVLTANDDPECRSFPNDL